MPSTRPPATPSPAGRVPGQRHGAELPGPAGGRGGRHPGALGVELRALAEAGDQHPAPAAAGRVLVGDRDLAQAGLGLAELHQRLERRIARATRPRTAAPRACRRRCPRASRGGLRRGSEPRAARV